MAEPWFSPEIARGFALLSLLSLLSLQRRQVERGRQRTWVLGPRYACAALGAVLLLLAGLGIAVQQPGYVIVTLGVSGAVILPLFLLDLRSKRAAYQRAELRRTVAVDL